MKLKIGEIAVKAGGVSAGAVLGTFANKFLVNINPKLRGFGKIVAGAVIPALISKGGKQNIADAVGSGVIASGAIDLANDFGLTSSVSGVEDVMAGVGAPIVTDEDFEAGVSGSEDEDVVSGN